MNYKKLEKDILNRLKNEIPSYYYYHNMDHTFDVLNSVTIIAKHENITEYDITLLKSAALIHDIGFVRKYEKHEETSSIMALDILPKYNYKGKDIERIKKMILTTSLKENPDNCLCRILCDADLDYLGRDDYYDKSMLLFREWNKLCCTITLVDWYKLQVSFLSKHKYHTIFSKKFREEKKKEILNQIKKLLECN